MAEPFSTMSQTTRENPELSFLAGHLNSLDSHIQKSINLSEENARLRENLRTLNNSAQSISTLYQEQLSKVQELQALNQQLQMRIESQEFQYSESLREQINKDALLRQNYADLEENSRKSYTTVGKSYLEAIKLLDKHDLLTRRLHSTGLIVSNDLLSYGVINQKDVVGPYIEKSPKKTITKRMINVSTSMDALRKIDKATSTDETASCHNIECQTIIVSTVEDALKDMIVMPEMLDEMHEIKIPPKLTVCCQKAIVNIDPIQHKSICIGTDESLDLTKCKETKTIGTVTDIQNIRNDFITNDVNSKQINLESLGEFKSGDVNLSELACIKSFIRKEIFQYTELIQKTLTNAVSTNYSSDIETLLMKYEYPTPPPSCHLEDIDNIKLSCIEESLKEPEKLVQNYQPNIVVEKNLEINTSNSTENMAPKTRKRKKNKEKNNCTWNKRKQLENSFDPVYNDIHKKVNDILTDYKMPGLIQPIAETIKPIEGFSKIDALHNEINVSHEENIIDKISNEPQKETSPNINLVYFESPASPPPELELNISLPKVVPIDDIRDYESPLSPIANNWHITDNITEDDSMQAINIPLERIDKVFESNIVASKYSNEKTIIHKMLIKYDSIKYKRFLNKLTRSKESLRESKILFILNRKLQNYLDAEWQMNSVKLATSKILRLTKKPKLISTAIFEVLESVEDEEIEYDLTPPAPGMGMSSHKITMLIKQIDNDRNGFINYVNIKIEKLIFSFNNKLKLKYLKVLSRIYLGLLDLNENYAVVDQIARMFIYKAMYYYGFMAYPIVYMTLLAYPQVLPKVTTSDFITEIKDPIILVIFHILANIGYLEQNSEEYHKADLFNRIRRHYGFECGKTIDKDIVTLLVDRIKTNNLRNVAFALILLGKRKGCEWAMNELIRKQLLPLVLQYTSELKTNEYPLDDRISTCLFTIASILKTQPLTTDVHEFQQVFSGVLNSSDRKVVQESAIQALLMTSRFSFADVFQRVRVWEPKYIVSQNIHAQLQTFIHRKSLQFWSNIK